MRCWRLLEIRPTVRPWLCRWTRAVALTSWQCGTFTLELVRWAGIAEALLVLRASQAGVRILHPGNLGFSLRSNAQMALQAGEVSALSPARRADSLAARPQVTF